MMLTGITLVMSGVMVPMVVGVMRRNLLLIILSLQTFRLMAMRPMVSQI